MHNIGPIALSVIQSLEYLGIRAEEECARLPTRLTVDDLDSAALIIALKEAEHLPLLKERFPAWADKVEYWHIEDAPEALALIEREVMDLVGRLK